MKKVLWLGIILSFIFASHSFAAYSLKATASGNTITATLTGVPAANSQDTYQLLIQTTPFTSSTYTGNATTNTPGTDPTQAMPTISAGDTTGTVTWSVSENVANATQYLIVLDIPSTKNQLAGAKDTYVTQSATLGTQAASIPLVPLTTSLQGSNILVSGQIDTTKTKANPGGFTATLSYSTSSAVGANGALSSIAGGPFATTTSIDSTTGKYSWTLNGSNLQPSTIYYIQQTVSDSAGNTVYDTVDSVNSSVGNIVIPGTASATADAQKRSYTFLSDPSGKTILPDPDLCAQEQAAATAAGKTPPSCDINSYINTAIEFLIGLSGVMLVLRLMYEGFVIMTTDIPFIQVKAKSGFMTALLGLLLALSSYIILNTINPKLVDENVGVTQLSIGIGGDTNAPTTFFNNGQVPQGISCPNTGRSAVVSQIAQSFQNRVTYSQALPKGAVGSDGYIQLDCSGYVNMVLKCAGYAPGKDFINDGTAAIFAGAEPVNMSSGFSISGSDVYINNKKLNPGDIVGWTPATDSNGNGHAILYIGNATFMDSHGGPSGRQPGNAIGTYPASQLQSRFSKNITSIKRIPL